MHGMCCLKILQQTKEVGHYCGFGDLTVTNQNRKTKRTRKEFKSKEGGGLQRVSRMCPHIIPEECWFNFIQIMLENSSLDSFKPVSFADIVSLNQSLSLFNISLQSFKRLTLTASTCQLRRHFSLSVYQSISVCLPFYFFSFCAGQNNP